MNPLCSSDWVQLWKEASDASTFKRCYQNTSTCYDIFAAQYDETMGGDLRRVEFVMRILLQQNLLQGCTILDIGSGTGSFSLPFSKYCSHLTALDVSTAMNQILKQKIADQKKTNIQLKEADFSDFEAEDAAFDLVFCSMNPGLYHPEPFQKMMRLCKKAGVYIGIAHHLAEPKKEASLDEKMLGFSVTHGGSNHILYPFNYLITQGYIPELFYIDCDWKTKETIDEASKRLQAHYERISLPKLGNHQTITDYITEKSNQGYYEEVISYRMGILLWYTK